LIGRKTAVAASAIFDDAIAELSMEAMAFLWRVHSGDAPDVRATAASFLRRLDVATRDDDLGESPAWQDNITSWRAVARLAGADVPWM
jgi:hypothetical protein